MGALDDDLLDPSAYPEPTPVVTRVETHGSRVFLTDRHAYKVKKAVNLGFLDYSTPGRRKVMCEAEVTLNRRLAPRVYLGVLPVVRGADGRHRLGGAGAAVDWAVRMLRMPDAERSDVLLAAGALDGRQIDALADRIAAFHGAARCDEETSRFGASDAIARNVRENFEQTRGAIESCVSAETAAAIESWQLRFLEEHARLFERRVKDRRVVEGHGDLRLEHAYFTPDGITILDGIEFNERFRMLDVCADIAFLTMDLAWHERVDLAERLLATYARTSGDYDLFALADFYESYRAYVRGKIATLMASDAATPDVVREEALAEGRRYFLLAASSQERNVVAPILIAVGGMIASGKSTVADAIGESMGAPVVDADRTRKRLLGVAPAVHVDAGAWSGAYDPAVTESVYAEVLRCASVVLASGRSVIVDASFRSRAVRDAALSLARAQGAAFHFIECRADVETCRARLERRSREPGAVSDARPAIFDDFRAHFEPVVELPPEMHVVVDTNEGPDAALRSLRAALPAWPHGRLP